MATTPLTGSRYPVSSDSANVAQYFANLAFDLDDNAVPRFTTTVARDAAYSAWVTAGGTMADGMLCAVNGVPYRRVGGNWRINRNRIILRSISAFGSGGVIGSGGAAETGSTAGYTTLSSFTLYEASTVSVMAHFRVNPGAAAGGLRVKIDGAQVGNAGATRNDISSNVIGSVALAAGSHSIALRVDAVGGSVTWTEGQVVVHEGIAE